MAPARFDPFQHRVSSRGTRRRWASVRVATRITLATGVALVSLPSFADYPYPFENAYLATISGTPEPFRADIPDTRVVERQLRSRPDFTRTRRVPPSLPYPDRLKYSVLLQKSAAPLTVIVAGTGSDHRSGSVLALMRALHAAGHHTLGLSSPTHPAFITAASSTGVPGAMQTDASDLLRVLGQAVDELQAEGTTITNYNLTGYSLGALNAAFMAHATTGGRTTGAQPMPLSFRRVLLINSPVSLYSSISKLDRFLENVPGGVDNLDQLFSEVIERLSAAYQRSSNVEFTQELIYGAFEGRKPSQEDMAALIGAVFRFSAMNLTFSADLVTDFGFLKPKEQRLGRRADHGPYLAVALRVGLTDYFHEFFWPEHQRLGTPDGADRFTFADAQSLHGLRDFLSSDLRVYAVHNRDDVILEAGEIDFFEPVFGNRVRLFPRGGHLGNLTEAEFMAEVVRVLTGG